MSRIIAAKYGGPCIKCGDQIKAGSFVNWDRGRGIWHLDEADNDKLGSSMLDPTAREIGDSCHSDTHHEEEKIMDPYDKNDTISVDNLIKVLQGMGLEVKGLPKKEEKQLSVRDKKVRRRTGPRKGANEYSRELTSKQISFCEFMALGSNRADAYTNSYDITNPAFSGNAGRKLLEHKKIRDKIAELRNDLGGGDVKDEEQDFFDAIKSKGATGGWAFKLTENQEKFCQAMASGATILRAFKKSGYVTTNWSEKRKRRMANDLMKFAKVKVRIADLMSGNAPDIKPAVAGENSHKTPRILIPAKKSVKAEVLVSEQPLILEEKSVINGEFVDNFVELIKAHGRLFHHAVVTRGQEEVGIPGADVRGVEEAVRRSIETLRETLEEKLL